MAQPKEATNPNAVMLEKLLYSYRKNMGPGNRKRSKNPTKGIKWIYPRGVERKLYNNIRALLKKIIDPNMEALRMNLDTWVNSYKLLTDSTTRHDVYPDDLRIHIEDLEAILDRIFKDNGPEVRAMITDIGFEVSEKNVVQWGKFTKALVGVELITTELWETEVIKAWAEENFTLIKSLSQEYIKKVNTIVTSNIQQGQTSNAIFKELRKLNTNISRTRARLIARDQVGKLNGQMIQRRMTDAGIDKYIWLTMGDERVRGNPSGPWRYALPSHYVMSNKICRWDDSTVFSEDGGKTWKKRFGKMTLKHPGQDIQCRCTAIPYVYDLIKQVDNLIAQEKRAA